MLVDQRQLRMSWTDEQNVRSFLNFVPKSFSAVRGEAYPDKDASNKTVVHRLVTELCDRKHIRHRTVLKGEGGRVCFNLVG